MKIAVVYSGSANFMNGPIVRTLKMAEGFAQNGHEVCVFLDRLIKKFCERRPGTKHRLVFIAETS